MTAQSSSQPPTWSLVPGRPIKRTMLHQSFGGSGQGGIGPSARSKNVFVFTDPTEGEKHGYFDDWMPDGMFHYTGEGQRGDQRMRAGNAAILRHRQDGRALRVFEGSKGTVVYLGEFEIADENPWYEADAPETNNGPIRRVIIFRLRPIDTQARPPQTRLGRLRAALTSRVQAVPLEQQFTEKVFVEPGREQYTAERREAGLVQALADYLCGLGHAVTRHQVLPEGESRPLFTDLFDADSNLLVEAKGSVTRENVRMAIGQLADYGRFWPEAKRAILLPTEPRNDLMELAHSQSIVIIWPTDVGYGSSRPGFTLA
ncbi:hypothetical protein SAMN05444920_10152 [Nonomuraea solani]|uniref:ScoMcrA-like SRA domain-containing protein n=1 Tax=Nonomuraea solani TaxID=1144553 RepID=A0A1H5SXF2_9ACTN|nr:restriction endonuclease [Nonomuraea solani]SEF55199.1 hypothetical protein SAMN05444920_10152 [Nonomuraea solani]